MADQVTQSNNVLDPQVLADMIPAKLTAGLKCTSLVQVHRTLEGKPGSTVEFPTWNYIGDAEDIKDDGNYYTVVPKTSRVKVNLKHKITKQLSKKSLAKKYMREKGIKDNKKRDLLINVLNKAEKLC